MMASPPPNNSKRRALKQFLQRNPNAGVNFAKRGPGATGSVSPPRKQVGQAGSSSGLKQGFSAGGGANQRAAGPDSQAYKNQLAAQAQAAAQAYKQKAGGPKKPGIPKKRKFTNNAPFARY